MKVRYLRRTHDAARTAPALMLAATVVMLQVPCAFASKDPPVPPGRDPAGVPVAIIGPGIDYLAPGVASRLARDGEGDIIGWDFIESDLRPYDRPLSCTGAPACEAANSAHASPSLMFLAEAGRSRLIVLRTSEGDRAQFASAVAFASKSPARIIPTFTSDATGAGPDWTILIEAARRFSNLLFIVPAYGPSITIPGFDNLALGNLLVVAPAGPSGAVLSDSTNAAPASADVAVAIATGDGQPATTHRAMAEQAAARLSAIAARLSGANPLLNASELKRRLLQLAQPLTGPESKLVRSGWIAAPQEHYRDN